MIVLSHLPEKNTHRRDTRREPRRKFIVGTTRRALVPGRVREFWTSYRLLVSTNRGERATIISRQSPRKSSQRTGTAPPLCANFSYGQKAHWDWQPISDLTGVTKLERYTHVSWHARTATHVHFHSYAHTYDYPPISIRAQTSPMPARDSWSNSVSPPNVARWVALDGEADGVPEPGWLSIRFNEPQQFFFRGI